MAITTFPKRPNSKWTAPDGPINTYIDALEGALDIVRRVLEGEEDDTLAVDYGGTGYEHHPAVISAYRVRAEIEECRKSKEKRT